MSKNSGGGGGGNTVTQTSQPPQQYLNAYSNLTDAAFRQAQTPLQQYSGFMVAGFTPQQQQGYQTVQNLQGSYAPYINAAAQEFGQATTPLWPTLPSYDVSGLPQGALNSINTGQEFGARSGNQNLVGNARPYANLGTAPINLP